VKTDSARQTRTATIIGGSIAGLTTGLALLRRGWDVHIYEATAGGLDQRGAGIITHQALFDVLEKLGVPSNEQIGVTINKRKTIAQEGQVVGTIELAQIATSWGRMYQLLKEQFPTDRYHQNKVITDLVQHNDTVDALFADGSSVTSHILIAADGIRSTVRRQLEPDATPKYAGYVAWRGLIDEQDLSREERSEIFPYFTFCLPEGEQVLTYPIAGAQHQTDEGHRRLNVVWYRPAATDTTLKELLTDTDGNNNGESIAPDKVRPAIIEKMQNDATRLLSWQHAKLVRKLRQPFIQPIYDLTTNTMAHHRIAIVGDAAFTARPHLGVGITKAAEDSLALADALEATADVPAALQQFDVLRRENNKRLVELSRELGAYLQAQLLSDDERHHAQLHRSMQAVMQETASPFIC
jgi:2-polyprenyl-6-methoxyphenol hydroxylase-like FAD-dependent oxidoreductase